MEPCRDTTERVRWEPGRAWELAGAVETGPGPDWPFKLEALAATALMVECARIDGEFTEEERDAICRAVMEEFALDEETAERLVQVAEVREDEVWHDWLFTETIKTGFDEHEQLAVVGKLWEITLADGTVHPFEEHLIARIASELALPEEAVKQRLTLALRRHHVLPVCRLTQACERLRRLGEECMAAKSSEEESWGRSRNETD